MAIFTLYDGTKVRLSDSVSDEEAFNILAKAFPDKAALAGVSPDIEREYDIRSGVEDLGVSCKHPLFPFVEWTYPLVVTPSTRSNHNFTHVLFTFLCNTTLEISIFVFKYMVTPN